MLVDNTGKVLLAASNLRSFDHIFQRPVVEGACIFECIPTAWRSTAHDALETLQRSAVPSIFEVKHVADDGKAVYYEIKCTGLRNEGEFVDQTFVVGRDITAEKTFEEKITIVARDYQSLIENAHAVIVGTDLRGYITEWNDMARQVTGYSRNESYIRRIADIVVPESEPTFTEAMKNVLNGHVITNYEMVIRARDERKLTLLINATPRTTSAGEIVGALLIGQDITELSVYRKSLEQKVRERTNALRSALENEKRLVEVKDRFVSMASHEFRSPIAYIHRNIAALQQNIETLDPAHVRERLEKIQTHAEHLAILLEDVLTMAKTGANTGRLQATLSPVDLKEFLHRIVEEVQTNTHQTHRIEVEFADPELKVHSDENLLRNIFINLLTNAIKFSPESDIVRLTAVKCGHKLEVQVRDYGLGIDEQDLARIFEPFHRGTNAQKIKGTGLGLPIVMKAVQALGGDINVESKPGRGSLFTVTLKLDNDEHHQCTN